MDKPDSSLTDITKQIYLKDASLEIVWEVCGRYWSYTTKFSGVCDVPQKDR